MREERCGTCVNCNRRKKICKITKKKVMLIDFICKDNYKHKEK